MLQDAQNQSIDDIMAGRGDKRREENADPKPAQSKAKTASSSQEGGTWTQAGHTRWTKDEPIPKAPPPKAARGRPPNQPEAEPKSPDPAPKRRGRPPNRGRSPTASSEKKRDRSENYEREQIPKPKPSPEKKIPVKKDPVTKQKHDTELVVLNDFAEWNAKARGFLVHQIHKRPGIKFTKTDAKKMSKKDMIELLLTFDGKI